MKNYIQIKGKKNKRLVNMPVRLFKQQMKKLTLGKAEVLYGKIFEEAYWASKGTFKKPIGKSAVRKLLRLSHILENMMGNRAFPLDKNTNGCGIERRFFLGRDRTHYDFNECSSSNWCQFETNQDDIQFGIWVNIQDRIVITFTEGEEYRVLASDEKSFRNELSDLLKSYRPGPSLSVIGDNTVTQYFSNSKIHSYLGVNVMEQLAIN